MLKLLSRFFPAATSKRKRKRISVRICAWHPSARYSVTLAAETCHVKRGQPIEAIYMAQVANAAQNDDGVLSALVVVVSGSTTVEQLQSWSAGFKERLKTLLPEDMGVHLVFRSLATANLGADEAHLKHCEILPSAEIRSTRDNKGSCNQGM
jgi:hypothetical protein